MTTFADRLKELRKQRNITQDELAKNIGLSKSTIGMYEQGNREPNYEMLETIADHFNVDIDYLVGRTNITTVVLPASGAEPQRRYLMDKIAKASPAKLRKFEKLMELIDDEETNNS